MRDIPERSEGVVRDIQREDKAVIYVPVRDLPKEERAV